MRKVVVIIFILGFVFLISGCSIKKTEELTDAEKFANEYSISEKNPFQYATINEVLELLESKSGILFLGDSDSEWSTFGVKILNKVLKEKKIDEVYYFNPEIIKNKDSKKYKKLVDLLELKEDSYLPIVYVIVSGKVVDHVDYPVHDDVSLDDNSVEELEEEYSDLISLYL
ncbi:MAG TPA: hypothetical protein IAB35_00205 [Candidatus Faecimonas gallistercoris]|nr:hypothetical protein [Candidatus Faecimonas gallistercoris]